MRADGKTDRTSQRGGTRRLKIKQKAIANVDAELLRRVRAHQGLSRVDLAHQLHLAPSTVGTYVDRLITEGFLSDGEKVERESGRPPTLLALEATPCARMRAGSPLRTWRRRRNQVMQSWAEFWSGWRRLSAGRPAR